MDMLERQFISKLDPEINLMWIEAHSQPQTQMSFPAHLQRDTWSSVSVEDDFTLYMLLYLWILLIRK